MTHLFQPEDHAKRLANLPEVLPILPLRNTVAFPFSIMPLAIGIPRSVRLIEDALQKDKLVGLVASKDGTIEEPKPGQIYEVGTVAVIHRVVQAPNNTLSVIIHGLERFTIDRFTETDPYLKAQVTLAPDQLESGLELDALVHSLRDLAKDVAALSPNLPDEVGAFLDQIDDPRYLVYLVAANAGLDMADGQRVLEAGDIKIKLHDLISHLSRQKEILSLGQKIKSDAKEEMDKAQREYYLRQQLKAIQKELGEEDEGTSGIGEYTDKLDEAKLPEEADREARRELKRMQGMPPHSAEYTVIKTYLDWLLELPWHTFSEDQLDIKHARQVLDEDHYDLQEVKDRLLEYLAVRKLVRDRAMKTEPGEEETSGEARGAILCLVGASGCWQNQFGQKHRQSSGTKVHSYEPWRHARRSGNPGP